VGSPRFTSLSPACDPPAVDAFLTSVDRVMNSNSLLLTAACEAPLTAENRQEMLHAFLRDALFEQALRAADSRRGWWNLEEAADRGDGAPPLQRPLVRADFHAALGPLDHGGFLARLRWMLCESPSPYDRHCPVREAADLSGAFVRELLGEDGPAWSFATVSPDFLRSSEYFGGHEPLPPVYFDGGAGDTATFVHRDRTFHLLLTNGSP
jgi:hypothetical protein